MARNVIKYRLKEDGTIPDFLYLGQDGVGGVFGVPDESVQGARQMVMIGITNDGATGDFEIIPTKEDLQNYLTNVGANWKVRNPEKPFDVDSMTPFDSVDAANWVWNRFEALL